MRHFLQWFRVIVLFVFSLGLVVPVPSAAESELDILNKKIEALQKEVSRLAQNEKRKSLEEKKKAVEEKKEPKSIVHLSGYGDVMYADAQNADGQFGRVKFAPIIHYMYGDRFMLESELEFEVDDKGETNTNLEYMTVDVVLNDYAVLLAGKFLSPIGQFRQNYHPSWINKLPSVPPGFGPHDAAAPLSDVGAMLRGGLPALGNLRTNYAIYVSNGPTLTAETEGSTVKLHGVVAEGTTSDEDGNKVFGGRLGFIPVPLLEIGISAATGKTAVTELDGTGVNGDGERNYDVFGTDFAWKWNAFDLRGEYIRTKVGDANNSSVAPEGDSWQTWYAQGSYQLQPSLLPGKLEGVIRYTDFNSPHASQDQKQWVVGLNYLFSNNVMAKFAYEFNDGMANQPSDDDRFLAQLAYGF